MRELLYREARVRGKFRPLEPNEAKKLKIKKISDDKKVRRCEITDPEISEGKLEERFAGLRVRISRGGKVTVLNGQRSMTRIHRGVGTELC